jgi:uncharacterized protein YoaH (UPF0181 family)
VKATPIKLQRLLQRLFAQQAREVASKINLDRGVPDLTHWVEATANAAEPVLLSLWQQGMVRAGARIAQSSKLEAKGLLNRSRTRMVLVVKAKRAKPSVTVDFDLFNPRVLDAVNDAAYKFCRDTTATATDELKASLDDLRKLMREGLKRGDAVQLLARKVRDIFADPARAFRIATTEASRAMHGGARMAGKESGVVKSWSWLASSDACEEVCLPLDGKTVKDGQPYVVLPGRAPYNVVYHPPAHPHCFCDETENIE